jgi:hypothetical protein
MDEFESTNLDVINLREKKNYFVQIDIIKAVMIFLVIFDHTFPWDPLKDSMGVALWERISIPVFLVILGFNMGISFDRKGETSLRKLYSWNYFKRKFWRYIFPFILLYFVSTIVGLAINGFDPEALEQYELRWDFEHLFIGILPFYGPGNWFLPVIFWSILIMPLLYKGFSGKLIWRIITLILCYVIELILQLAVYFIFDPRNISSWPEYFDFIFYFNFVYTTPFFMLSAIGLGMWISRNHNIFAKQNIIIWILFPLSLFYLIQSQFSDFYFDFILGDYHLFVFPYSAFLVLVGLKLLPKKQDNIFIRGIAMIGKSTYHILLTQILYFAIVISIWGDHYGASIVGINSEYELNVVFGYTLINWLICIPLGVLWWYGETKIRNYRLKQKS